MDRDEFMELVYETFADEPDNVLANGIIEAADAYAEHEKAQLLQEGKTKGTTSDLISRQAAIDALDFEIVHMTAYCDGKNEGNPLAQYNKGLEDGKKAIEALPSAQPERKKGEWIEISSINHTYKCSECGRLLVNVTDGKNNVSKHYPYCHCGAKMRGEKDG